MTGCCFSAFSGTENRAFASSFLLVLGNACCILLSPIVTIWFRHYHATYHGPRMFSRYFITSAGYHISPSGLGCIQPFTVIDSKSLKCKCSSPTGYNAIKLFVAACWFHSWSILQTSGISTDATLNNTVDGNSEACKESTCQTRSDFHQPLHIDLGYNVCALCTGWRFKIRHFYFYFLPKSIRLHCTPMVADSAKT